MKPEEMTQEAAIALLKEGKEAWEEWLKEHGLSPEDLKERQIRRRKLTFLEGANLSGFQLIDFDLRGFSFRLFVN